MIAVQLAIHSRIVSRSMSFKQIVTLFDVKKMLAKLSRSWRNYAACADSRYARISGAGEIRSDVLESHFLRNIISFSCTDRQIWLVLNR